MDSLRVFSKTKIILTFFICILTSAVSHGGEVSGSNNSVKSMSVNFTRPSQKPNSESSLKGPLDKLFCGRINILKIDPSILAFTLDTQTDARKAGTSIVPCGLPGDELNICRGCSTKITTKQMTALRPMLTNKAHKTWHYNWHRVNGADITTLGNLIEAKLVPSKNSSQFLLNIIKNRGENFFYMHRQMIKMVNIELTSQGLPCIAPWYQPPSSIFDVEWPVPVVDKNDSAEEQEIYVKDLDRINNEYKKLSDPAFLKKTSLEDLGDRASRMLHTSLHELYEESSQVTDKKCQGDLFTSTTCDSLLNSITNAYNPHFWKLHGLIDSLVGKWLTANDNKKIISEDCTGKKNCYTWKGKYVGESPFGR